MARKITVDIAATGSVDGSFTSAMSQMQTALKSVKTDAKGAGDSFTQLTRQVSQQRSTLRSLQQEYAVMLATGDAAGADSMLEQVITMQGALEQNKSIVESVRQAMQGLSNVDAETASNISRLTTEINQQETELSQLQNEYQQAVSTYGEGSAQAQKLATEIQQLTSKLDSNKQSLSEQMDAAKRMAQGFEQINSETKKLQSTISKQKTDLNQLKAAFVETALKEGQTSNAARELGQQIASLSAELAGNENKFREASAAADAYDQSLQGAEKAASSGGWKNTAIGNLVAQGIDRAKDVMWDFSKSIFTTGADFQSEMARVGSISGATGEELQLMTDQARYWGKQTIYSATDSAKALEYMSLAGWDAGESITALPTVLQLAAAAGMDLGQTSDMVTDYMGAFGMKAEQAGDFANKMIIASTNSNTSVSQLGEAFRNSAANMNAMGQSVDTTTAVLSVLADNGIKGSRAGTQLSAIMRDLNSHMKDGAVQIGKTSVAISDAQGNYRQLTDIIKDVNDATQGMSETERAAALSSIFTADSQKGMFTLLNSGNEKLAERQELLANETMDQKALENMYRKQTDTLSGSWEALKSGIQEVKLQLSDMLSPLAKGMLDFANTSVLPFIQNILSAIQSFDWSNAFSGIKDAFSNVWNSLGKSGQGLVGSAGILGGAFAAFKGFGKIKDSLSGLFKGFNPFSGIVSSANSAAGQTKGIFASLGSGIKSILEGAGNAIKAVFEGIGSLSIQSGAGFAMVVGSISLALAGLSMVGEPVLTFLHGLADVLLQLTGGILSQFASFIQQVAAVFPQFCAGLAELSPLIEAFGTAISTVIQGIGQAVATVLPALTPLVQTIGNIFNQTAQIVANAIVQIVQALAPVMPAVSQMVSAISNAFSQVAQVIGQIIGQISPILDSCANAFRGFGDAVRNALDGVGGIIESVGNAIKSVFEGISGLVESVGHAFMNAGKGFDLFAQGCERLNSCNLLGIAGGIAAMLGPVGGLALAGGGLASAGQGMLQLAVAMQMLASSAAGIMTAVTAIQMMTISLQTVTSQLTSLGPSLMAAVTQISVAFTLLSTTCMTSTTAVQASLTMLVASFTTSFSTVTTATQSAAAALTAIINIIAQNFNTLSTRIRTSMSQAAQAVVTYCNKMRSTMQSTINAMVAATNSGMASIRSAFSSTFASLSGIVASGMASAVASVNSGVASMRAALSVRLEGPHIAVPHFSMSGKFDPKTGAVPTVSVSYYKKGGIMDSATVFGANGNNLMVGGEAGQEAILPLDPFWNRLDSFLDSLTAMMTPSIFDLDEQSLASALDRNSGSTYSSSPTLNFSPQIVINGSGGNSNDVAKQVSDEIESQTQAMFERFKQMMQEEEERRFSYGF